MSEHQHEKDNGEHSHHHHHGHHHDHEGEHHHHHGHHRHRSLLHRIKRKLKRKKWILPSLIFVAVALAAAALWSINAIQAQEKQQIVSGKQKNVGSGYRDVSYQGKHYRYNSRITTILYAGVDSDTPLVQTAKYTMAPRADSISLVVLDEMHHKITVIALNRDTMTRIRKYTLNGKSRGMFKDHLGYAYTYGNGGKESCESLCEAISELLYGVPINEYVISNRASLPLLGDVIGPVSVTVPNDDLADENAAYTAGSVVTIDASNLETFVRSRDTSADLSNVGRMERQQAYINGAMEQILKLLRESPNNMWKIIQEAEDCVQTNITRSRYLDLTRVLKNTSYSAGDYYIPEGEQVVGDFHDEFYPDEDALLQKVIDIFYIER